MAVGYRSILQLDDGRVRAGGPGDRVPRRRRPLREGGDGTPAGMRFESTLANQLTIKLGRYSRPRGPARLRARHRRAGALTAVPGDLSGDPAASPWMRERGSGFDPKPACATCTTRGALVGIGVWGGLNLDRGRPAPTARAAESRLRWRRRAAA